MAFDYHFLCPLPLGIHARPASAIEEVARRFTADITIVNERTGQPANAKSVLGMVSLDIRHGDRVRLLTVGSDAGWAIESLRRFVEHDLPHCDDALPSSADRGADATSTIPAMLARSGARVFGGTAVVGGLGFGHGVRLGRFVLPATIARDGIQDTESEIARIADGFERLGQAYEADLARRGEGVDADVLRAHRAVARDPDFAERIVAAIRDRRLTAAGAIVEAEAQFTEMLTATDSALLRERALDIRDVCVELLHQVYGDEVSPGDVELPTDAVCVADAMTPGQFLKLDRERVRGLVLAHAGTTSHTIVLARSFGIPTVVGVEGADTLPIDGVPLVVDGHLGVLVTDLTDAARRYYDMEVRRLQAGRTRMLRFVDRPAATMDDHRIELAANIGSAAEVAGAVAAGAEGIGLFRTEMLFVDRQAPPDEDEQVDEYRRALTDAGGRRVIIRTLDIGGDKPVPYLPLPREDNPFLGFRAVRLYPEYETVFRTQVRALLRASTAGRLQIMVPMVARIEEVRWVRSVLAQERARLVEAGLTTSDRIPLGAMIEVPAAAFQIEALCRELEFFSVGTNDLLQYFNAADRGHPRLAELSDPLTPPFLRLLDRIVDQVHIRGRWVGLCGEMGGRVDCLPLLVGLGFDEISMAPPALAAAKADIHDLSMAGCRALVDRATACDSATEIAPLITEGRHRRVLPLIEPELVVSGADCRTREEAVKTVVDQLAITGRTDRPRDVEDAVWRREAVYATALGHGFAIPHCRTDAVRANSLVVARLDTGVPWSEGGEAPVHTVILLAIRESDQATTHLKVLASLARRLMHEEFRDRVRSEADPEALCRFLAELV